MFAPGVEQRLRQIEIALLRGPVEGGHTVALRRVHVGALLQERADRVLVALHRGLDDRGGRGSAQESGEEERAHGSHRDRSTSRHS
jgi:hypothetical protein